MGMKVRSTYPDYWEDEKIGRLSRDARLAFVWTWNAADDYGRLRFSVDALGAGAFRFDRLTPEVLATIANELVDSGRIVVYACRGEHFAAIPAFTKWQRISTPVASRLPHPRDAEVTGFRFDPDGRPVPLGERVIVSASPPGDTALPPVIEMPLFTASHPGAAYRDVANIDATPLGGAISTPTVCDLEPPDITRLVLPEKSRLSCGYGLDPSPIENPPTPLPGGVDEIDPQEADPPGPSPKPPGKDRHPPCPYDEIRQRYNALFVPLGRPECRKLGHALQKTMGDRWCQDLEGDGAERLAAIFAYLERAAASRSLTGRKPGFDWEGATLLWLMGPKNWAKVEAGCYDDTKRSPPQPTRPVVAPIEPPVDVLDIRHHPDLASTRPAAEALLAAALESVTAENRYADLAACWFRPPDGLVAAGFLDGHLVLEAPTPFAAQWVRDNVEDVLRDRLWDLHGAPVVVLYRLTQRATTGDS